MEKYYGVIAERVNETDWLGEEIILPRAPKGTNSFIKNGSIQYAQTEVSPVSCTIHGAMGAYSALTGYKFTLDERKTLWSEALARGVNPKVGWYINDAVDLVRNYVNDNLKVKVCSYRINLGSFEHGVAMRLGYSVITGYRGNALWKADRDDNGIINNTKFVDTTYGHCLHSNYSIGDEYDRVVDSYPARKTNLFSIPTANWKQLVLNKVFFSTGYIYIVKP